MSSLAIAVRCAKCGHDVPERPGGSVSARKPCAACGSLERRMGFRSTADVIARLAPNEPDNCEDADAAEPSADELERRKTQARLAGLRHVVRAWSR
jgi:hypothetical protein